MMVLQYGSTASNQVSCQQSLLHQVHGVPDVMHQTQHPSSCFFKSCLHCSTRQQCHCCPAGKGSWSATLTTALPSLAPRIICSSRHKQARSPHTLLFCVPYGLPAQMQHVPQLQTPYRRAQRSAGCQAMPKLSASTSLPSASYSLQWSALVLTVTQHSLLDAARDSASVKHCFVWKTCMPLSAAGLFLMSFVSSVKQ